MYTLYHQDGTRSGAALLALEEGGLSYELRDVDISAYDHRREVFLKINPRGLIPTLLTDTGEVICETAAIMMYVADRHKLAHLAPLPEEAGRGALLDWLFYHVGEVQEAGKRGPYSQRYSTDVNDAPPHSGQSAGDVAGALADCRQTSNRQRSVSSRRAFQPGRSLSRDHGRLAEGRCSSRRATFTEPLQSRRSAGREALLRFGIGTTTERTNSRAP